MRKAATAIAFLALALFARGAGAQQITVFPLVVDLAQKRTGVVFVQNNGEAPIQLAVKKEGGNGWLVVGPERQKIGPGATGKVKVGRLDQPESSTEAAVILEVAGGNAVKVPVRVK